MKVALLGDIALFGRMSVRENPYTAEYFSDVAEYLKGFDYVIGNLETPFSSLKKTNGAKSAYICSDVENVQTLKQLHINAVCLANNHMFDFGDEGYETTKKILEENKIDYFGTEGKEVRVEYGGNKLALSGFCCYTTNPLNCVPYGKYGVNAYNIPKVEEILIKNKEQGYLNIVAVHAGLEHVNYPSIDHVRAARKLSEVTPFVYYGHHPHVIQGIEEYNGSLITYSLGNFCFDDIYTKASGNKPLVTLSENNRHGAIIELTIENNRVVDWREQVIYNSIGKKMTFVEAPLMLKEYDDAVINCENDVIAYQSKRNKILDERTTERKKTRNLRWYIKRLRPQYFKLFFDGRKNAKLFNDNIKKYINEL